MGMNIGGKNSGVKAEINVTPLVDIVLVLLIIFIVITPAVSDAVTLPTAKHSEKVSERDPELLTLIFKAGKTDVGKPIEPGSICVDGLEAKDAVFSLASPGGREQLKDLVRKHTAGRQEKRVFIKADASIPFKHVNDLFQLCRDGGAEEASIVTGEEIKPNKGEPS
jgi:biopolymer transport protein ExbD